MTETGRVVTLCFHGIGSPERQLEPGEKRFWIDPSRYADILDAVQEASRGVDITFDDGNESDHRFGLPGLLDRSLRAEFFVIAGRIDHTGSISRSQLMELQGAGMPIGNHGMRHLPWREITDQTELEEEVWVAARLIEEVVGVAPTHAACPRGSYGRRVLSLLRRHGYSRVYSVDEGSSSRHAWLRSRYTVISTDTPESVLERIERPDGPLTNRLERSTKQFIKRWR